MQPSQFYATYAEWKSSVIKLKITSKKDYLERRKSDTKLRSNPRYYKEFSENGGFKSIIVNDKYYPTFEAWSLAAKSLGITSWLDYKARYKEDPKLPSDPGAKYPEYSVQYGFANVLHIDVYYSTFEEWKAAVISLNITSWKDYKCNYKRDPKLYSNPDKKYKEFKESGGFKSIRRYVTYGEWLSAVNALGIKCALDYNKNYKRDTYLPRHPKLHYKEFEENGGFQALLTDVKFYQTYQEWKSAIVALDIKSWKDYKARYKEDPKLFSNPTKLYPMFTELGGMGTAPRLSATHQFYATYREWKEASIAIRIVSTIDYQKRYRIDPKLHSFPADIYENFTDMGGFRTVIIATKAIFTKDAQRLNLDR
jgi:hypothetical protein